MKICIYGAASSTIDKKYIDAVESLGEKMAMRGHELIFGAGDNGMMGAAARGVKKAGGTVIGISPSFFNVDGVLFPDCDEMYRPDTMRERKMLMEEHSDAFIVTAGGIGTFEEFFVILTLKQLCRHSKPIVIYNIEDSNKFFKMYKLNIKTGIKKIINISNYEPSLMNLYLMQNALYIKPNETDIFLNEYKDKNN